MLGMRRITESVLTGTALTRMLVMIFTVLSHSLLITLSASFAAVARRIDRSATGWS
jgi:hypothetical protein